MKLKVITLTEPYATLVVIGAKRIETRNWRGPLNYRGPVMIQASKNWPMDYRRQCDENPHIKAALADVGVRGAEDLYGNCGCVIGAARVVRSYRFEAGKEPALPELAFGDFTAGRIGIVLTEPRRLRTPLPVRGALGLWDWEPASPNLIVWAPGTPIAPTELFVHRAETYRLDSPEPRATRLSDHRQVTWPSPQDFTSETGMLLRGIKTDATKAPAKPEKPVASEGMLF